LRHRPAPCGAQAAICAGDGTVRSSPLSRPSSSRTGRSLRLLASRRSHPLRPPVALPWPRASCVICAYSGENGYLFACIECTQQPKYSWGEGRGCRGHGNVAKELDCTCSPLCGRASLGIQHALWLGVVFCEDSSLQWKPSIRPTHPSAGALPLPPALETSPWKARVHLGNHMVGPILFLSAPPLPPSRSSRQRGHPDEGPSPRPDQRGDDGLCRGGLRAARLVDGACRVLAPARAPRVRLSTYARTRRPADSGRRGGSGAGWAEKGCEQGKKSSHSDSRGS